jgi:hypothetical protein
MKLWTALMIATGIAMSFVLTCITPFPAIAAWAARTVSPRLAVAAVLGALAGNQIAGYAFLGYPHMAATYAWGPMMAVACFAALAIALPIRNLLLGFAAAFVVYEAVIFGFSAATHTLADFTGPSVLLVLEANLSGFVILAVLRAGQVAIERIVHARAAHAHR